HPLPPDQCQTDHHGDGHRCPCTCCRGVSAGNVRTNPGAGMSETRLIDEPTIPTMGHKIAAEALGTFVLVFGGCGAAVLAANVPTPEEPVYILGIGFLGVALAFGLTVLIMAYAVGHVSGGHFNPAVTLGAAASGRFPWKDTLAYIGAQLVGGIIAAAVLFLIASGKAGFNAVESGFATNGYGERSPDGYGLL